MGGKSILKVVLTDLLLKSLEILFKYLCIMKMKLSQRLMLKYYKAKIRTIGMVSPEKAAAEAFDLFSTPFKSKKNPKIPPVFHQSLPVSVEVRGITIRGFQWKSELAQARKVLIVHGFSSYSYKFEQYIVSLKKEGFEVLAFDAPGHGISDGKKINALIYRDTILAIESNFGPLYGIIAHSMGGLAAALAMELMTNTKERKLVLIAPATETKRAIENLFTQIPVKPIVRQAFDQYVTNLAGKPISYFSVARVVRTLDARVLWIHDETDAICTFEDVAPLLNETIPSTEFIITKGLGHNQVYKEASSRDHILSFIQSPAKGDFL
ncbi:MAG: Alpha/beta hydrolase family protein [Bacteroidetes bacterium ADurb.BinA245]|nr:MAG: Alpha/beta hydrolase family protein [Bacteroidetes bacterium ADurb.BinA245]